jgi:hypothetical protein
MSEELNRAPKSFIANRETDYLEGAIIEKKFRGYMEDEGIKVLAAEIERDGFRPVRDEPQAFVGWRETYKGKDGKTVDFELDVEQFEKPGMMDKASLGMVTIASGENRASYKFALIAPDGNFDRVVEFTVDPQNKTVRASSWWTEFVDCLRRRCASSCASALGICGWNWWCIISRCFGCGLRCAACATCDCRWWCRWAVGCC